MPHAFAHLGHRTAFGDVLLHGVPQSTADSLERPADRLPLTGAGIEDNIIGLLTGHKSRELRRYQHLREELKRKTVDLIAGVLKEAGKNGKGASSSRLLHGAAKKPKSER